MELNWTTFVLELFNFVVLIWILKRFLYQPVLDVIERRRLSIENTLAEADTRHKEADALRQQYEQRLADWEQEKEQAYTNLQQDLALERDRLHQALLHSIEEDRQKAEAIEARQADDRERQYQERAVEQGARFTSRLLQRFAAPELEGKLLELLLDELGQLSESQLAGIRKALGSAEVIRVHSGHELSDEQRNQLQRGFDSTIGSNDRAWTYQVQPELLAGLRIEAGAWVLRSSLADELHFFQGAHRG